MGFGTGPETASPSSQVGSVVLKTRMLWCTSSFILMSSSLGSYRVSFLNPTFCCSFPANIALLVSQRIPAGDMTQVLFTEIPL